MEMACQSVKGGGDQTSLREEMKWMFQDIPLHLLIAVIVHKYLGEWMFDLMANGSPYFTDDSTPQI